MASGTKLNKALWTNLTRLKLLSTTDSSSRFILDRSPFDDDDEEPRNLYTIIGRIFPQSEIYKDYSIQIEMKLTANYPMEPPEVRFLTRIYHPNVDTDGKSINYSQENLIERKRFQGNFVMHYYRKVLDGRMERL